MADVTTQDVVALLNGTGITVDVTNANLLSDITIKDFAVVLSNSTFDDVAANWVKLSKTSIRYDGPILSNESVIIRRQTPVTQLKAASYAERVVSSDWNAEVDRLYRRLAEHAEFNTDYLKGSLGSGVGSILDTAYSVAWDTDTSNTASRNALYDELNSINTQQSTNTADIATNTGDIATNLASIQDIQDGYNFTGPIEAPGITTSADLTLTSTADIIQTGGTESTLATTLLNVDATTVLFNDPTGASGVSFGADGNNTNLTLANGSITMGGNGDITLQDGSNLAIEGYASQNTLNVQDVFLAQCPSTPAGADGQAKLGANINLANGLVTDDVLPAVTVQRYIGGLGVADDTNHTYVSTDTNDPCWCIATLDPFVGLSWGSKFGPHHMYFYVQLQNNSGGAFAPGSGLVDFGDPNPSITYGNWTPASNDRLMGYFSGTNNTCELYWLGTTTGTYGGSGSFSAGSILLVSNMVRRANYNT